MMPASRTEPAFFLRFFSYFENKVEENTQTEVRHHLSGLRDQRDIINLGNILYDPYVTNRKATNAHFLQNS